MRGSEEVGEKEGRYEGGRKRGGKVVREMRRREGGGEKDEGRNQTEKIETRRNRI
jgi:hypothetical protein